MNEMVNFRRRAEKFWGQVEVLGVGGLEPLDRGGQQVLKKEQKALLRMLALSSSKDRRVWSEDERGGIESELLYGQI